MMNSSLTLHGRNFSASVRGALDIHVLESDPKTIAIWATSLDGGVHSFLMENQIISVQTYVAPVTN